MNAGHTTTYFDQLSPEWADKYRSRHFRTRLETVLAWVGERCGKKACSLLDFGCGSGVFLKALADQGHTVTGVDASAGMIEASRAALGDSATGDAVRLEVVDPGSFEGAYRQQTYDGVCCMGVLEYVAEDATLLGILGGLIKEHGFLVLSVPNRSSFLRQIEQFVHQNPGFFKAFNLFPHLTGPDAYLNFQKHQYTQAELDALLTPLGLRRVRARYHVAPGFFGALAGSPAWGMTVIALYERV